MTFYIKPNPEKSVNGKPLQVLDPVRGEFIQEEGAQVPETAYWIRRLQEGSVVLVNAKSEAKKATPEKEAKKVADVKEEEKKSEVVKTKEKKSSKSKSGKKTAKTAKVSEAVVAKEEEKTNGEAEKADPKNKEE